MIRLEWVVSIALAAAVAPLASRATTVGVTGGPGLDSGEICLASGLCPAPSPSFSLATAGATTGTFAYDPVAQTVVFDLTLGSPATFSGTGGSIQLLAGSTFTGQVSVTSSVSGSGILVAETPAAAFGAETINFSSGSAALLSTPIISALTCTIGTGSDQCGVTLGPTLNQLSNGGTTYSAQYTFNVNTTAVPLPAAALLLLSGLGGMGWLRRRDAKPA